MGEAICRLFAKEGAKVVVADYNFEGAEKVASEINTQTPDAATAIKTDVSIETDINAMIGTAITFFGKVDILINNAGIMDGFEPVGEVTNARWDRVFTVNVNGPMYASRKAIQYFLEQGHGNIINIASIGGLQGGRAGAAYVASKHAVIGLTKNTAFMYAKKVSAATQSPQELSPPISPSQWATSAHLARKQPASAWPLIRPSECPSRSLPLHSFWLLTMPVSSMDRICRDR